MARPREDMQKELQVRPCVGGYQSKYAAPIVIPSQSPDCLNVLFDKRSIRRREGCVPVNRFLAPKDSLRNQGKVFIGRDGALAAANFKSVPGHGIIGHRPIFNTYRDPAGVFANLTVSFLCMPEPNGDDYSEPPNWFTWNTNAVGAQKFAGYRPICSKGPLRSNEYQDGEAIGWSIGIYNNDGGAGGGPFPTAGTAVWYAIVQTNATGAPILIRSSATSKQRPRPGHIYRITLACTSITAGGGNARLIIAELNGDRTVSTETVTQTLDVGVLTINTGPITVFDMPPACLNAPNARGGLNVGATAWEESSLRYEGRIQDLSLWAVDKTTNGADVETFVRSMLPVDLSVAQPGLIGYWKPDVPSDKWSGTWDEDQTMILEGRGIDAPMLMCPGVPKWNRANGRTGLYFNGRTSFAFMPTGVNTVFAGGAAPTGGTNAPAFVGVNAADNSFERLTIGGGTGKIAYGHSLSVTVVPDALEAVADVAHGGGAEVEGQCVLFWYGVVKFGISSRGRIYCAPMDVGGFMATQFYDPFPGFAGVKVIPGQRYSILYRRTSATTAEVYLNGQLIGNPAPGGATGGVTSGLPLMLLGTEDAIDTGPAPDVSSGRENTRATSRTLHFHGRIEDVRIGGASLSPFEGFQVDLQEADLYKDGAKTWGLDDGAATATGARTSNGRAGFLINVPGHTSSGLSVSPFYNLDTRVPLFIDATATDTVYNLFAAPRAQAVGGFDQVTAAFGRVSQYVGWWNFNASSLTTNLESRYRTSREYTGIEFIYRQLYAIPDNQRFALPLTLCSREPSQLGGAILTFFPWIQTTPDELTPKLAMGLVPDLPNQNPITLISRLQAANTTATIAAAGSSVYWLKSPWQKGDSPYLPAADPTQTSLFFSGRLWNHLQVEANSTWDLATNANLVVEFWMKVPELGVRREIAMNWDGSAADAFQWRIVLTESGAIFVEGYSGAGFWRFGTIVTDTANDRHHTPITPGRWHFIQIVMDTGAGHTGQKVYVDAEDQPLDDMVGSYAAGWLGGTGRKWIGGHRHDFIPARTTVDTNIEPFLGWMRDFRVGTAITPGTVPRVPLSLIAGSISLLPLNDGADNSIGASGSTVARGTLRCEEMLPILDGGLGSSHSSALYPYDATQYLNVLYMTNGLGNPLALRFGQLRSPRFADAYAIKAPWGFRSSRMGVGTPAKDLPTLTGQGAGAVFTSGNPISIAVTFLTEDGIESDPTVYNMTVPAGGPFTSLRVNGLPRSTDTHVIARNVYVGVTTPTLFIATNKTADNFTDDVELTVTAGTGQAVTADKAAPPPARYIVVFRGRSYLLNQPLAGPQELYVSSPAAGGTTIENFSFSGNPSINIIRLESGTNGAGTFLIDHLDALYAGTRDCVFQIAPGVTFDGFQVGKLNASKGFFSGASVAAFDNHVFGAMEKGVHVFDGSGIDYIGEDLEGLWNNVDKTDAATLLMRGVYFETTNQYWLTLRRTGEQFGRELVVFDKVVTDPSTDRNPWALLKTVRHSYLQRVDDEVDHTPRILLGTPEGQVMQLLTGGIDGNRGVANPATGTAFTLSGTATGGTTTTLAMASAAFDTLGHGFKGLLATVTHVNGTLEEVRILSNDGTTLTFESALSATVAAGDTFVIGTYWAYYSTPWLNLGSMTNTKVTRWLDLDFLPQAGSLEVRALAAILGVSLPGSGVPLRDAFDYNAVLLQNRKSIADMSYGFHPETIRFETSRGLYWRGFFGTRGVNVPFEVFGWNAGFEDDGNRKGLTS